MFILDRDLKLEDWEFSQRKNLPYEVKVQLAAKSIREWYDYFKGMVFLSFSGGLDSTVLAHMIDRELGRGAVLKVFVDTGLEIPQIREFVHSFDVEVIYPECSFRDVILEKGYPLVSKEVAATIRKLRNCNLSDRYRNYLLNGDERGSFAKLSECWKFLIDAPFETSEECCIIMKERPLVKYMKETGRVPYIGITQDESRRRSRQYSRTGCNVYQGKLPKSQPLGPFTAQDVKRYALENNVRYCSVYGDISCKDGVYYNTGVQRTGCRFCCMGCHLEKEPNRFQRMRVEDPKAYEFIMKPVREGGLGFDYVLNYCNIPH